MFSGCWVPCRKVPNAVDAAWLPCHVHPWMLSRASRSGLSPTAPEGVGVASSGESGCSSQAPPIAVQRPSSKVGVTLHYTLPRRLTSPFPTCFRARMRGGSRSCMRSAMHSCRGIYGGNDEVSVRSTPPEASRQRFICCRVLAVSCQSVLNHRLSVVVLAIGVGALCLAKLQAPPGIERMTGDAMRTWTRVQVTVRHKAGLGRLEMIPAHVRGRLFHASVIAPGIRLTAGAQGPTAVLPPRRRE